MSARRWSLWLIAFLFFFVLAGAPGQVLGGGAGGPGNPGIDFGSLGGLSRDELQARINEIGKGREAFESQLISQLRDPSSENAKLCAIFLAGYFRMDSAVGDLSKLIATHNKGTEAASARPSIGEWPAFEALVRIGSPALPAVVQNLARSGDPIVRDLSAQVVVAVLGPQLAKEELREAISNQIGPDAKSNSARLQIAVDSIVAPAK